MSLKKAFGANEKLRRAFLSSFVSRLLSLGNEARLAPTKTLIKRNAIIFVVSQRQDDYHRFLEQRRPTMRVAPDVTKPIKTRDSYPQRWSSKYSFRQRWESYERIDL